MSNIVPLEGSSPFDAIRKYRPDGSEYWKARELMPLIGYSRWERVPDVISRAKLACQNSGAFIDENFFEETRKSSGRDASDYVLSRYASYLVAMNGDPRKPEVAAAQSYFAVKTHEAETGKDALKILKENNKTLELQLSIAQANLEALKIEKGIIAPARPQKYKVIDLTGIDNIESVEAYIRDRIKLNPSSKVYVGKADGNPKKLLYPNYLEYCNQHDYNVVTVQRFSRVLMQLVYATMQAKLWKGKDRTGCHVKGVEIAA